MPKTTRARVARVEIIVEISLTRTHLIMKVALLYIIMTVTSCLVEPAAARILRAEQRAREERSAHWLFGLGAAGGTYAGSGRLYRTWQPGGMAYRPIRHQLLSRNQRVAASLTAAAAGITAARQLIEKGGDGADMARSLGKLGVVVVGPFDNAWQSLQQKRAAAELRRKDARRKAWLREKTKQAIVYRPD